MESVRRECEKEEVWEGGSVKREGAKHNRASGHQLYMYMNKSRTTTP